MVKKILWIGVSTLFIAAMVAGCATPPQQRKSPPGSSKAVDLAELHFNKGEYDLAINHAKKAIESDPVNAQKAWFWLGVSYDRKGQMEDARQAFEQILKLKSVNNSHEWAYRGLAGTYHFKEFDKALAYYNKALELAPGNKNTILSRGFIYLFKGMYEKAVLDFNNFLKSQEATKESKGEADRGLAFTYLGLGDSEKSFAMLRKAEEVNSNYSSFLDMGLIYYALGDEKKLKEHFGKRGFLGVDLRTAKDVKAAEVVKVREGSPAEKAGMLNGDLILQMNGVPFEDHHNLIKKLSTLASGATVTLKIERGKEVKNLSVVLGSGEIWMSKADMEKSLLIGAFLAKERMMRKTEEAVRNNNLRIAFQTYMEYIGSKEGYSFDDKFIERIITLVRKLDPPPAIPEEARRHAIRAEASLKKAKSDEDYVQVYGEFEQALRLAPWWADAYLNFGLAQEGGDEPAGAIRNFKLFLLASPDDPVSGKVRNKIYSLEVEAEKAAELKRWEGKWQSESGSLMKAKVKGVNLTITQVQPSSTAQGVGWRPGDVVFYGTVNGSRIEGKKVIRTKDQKVMRCFGERFEDKMTGILSPDGNLITNRIENQNFNINTCAINYVSYYEEKFTRIPE